MKSMYRKLLAGAQCIVSSIFTSEALASMQAMEAGLLVTRARIANNSEERRNVELIDSLVKLFTHMRSSGSHIVTNLPDINQLFLEINRNIISTYNQTSYDIAQVILNNSAVFRGQASPLTKAFDTVKSSFPQLQDPSIDPQQMMKSFFDNYHATSEQFKLASPSVRETTRRMLDADALVSEALDYPRETLRTLRTAIQDGQAGLKQVVKFGNLVNEAPQNADSSLSVGAISKGRSELYKELLKAELRQGGTNRNNYLEICKEISPAASQEYNADCENVMNEFFRAVDSFVGRKDVDGDLKTKVVALKDRISWLSENNPDKANGTIEMANSLRQLINDIADNNKPGANELRDILLTARMKAFEQVRKLSPACDPGLLDQVRLYESQMAIKMRDTLAGVLASIPAASQIRDSVSKIKLDSTGSLSQEDFTSLREQVGLMSNLKLKKDDHKAVKDAQGFLGSVISLRAEEDARAHVSLRS